MPVALVNDARINCLRMECSGSSESEELILIHGLAASMAFWSMHAQEFSDQFNITLYDLRGHGRSSVTEHGYSAQDMSVDLEILLDTLEIDKAHILAHSFGGVVALDFACRYPERVTSLVLADTHISEGRKNVKKTPWKHGKAIDYVLKKHGIDIDVNNPFFGFFMLKEIARLKTRDAEIPGELKAVLGQAFERYDKRSAANWLKLINNSDIEQEIQVHDGLEAGKLSRLNLPVMGMYGEYSQAISTLEYLAAILPEACFCVFKNAGHFFPLSCRAEMIEECKKFWERVLDNSKFSVSPEISLVDAINSPPIEVAC